MSAAADILALLARHDLPEGAVTRIGLTPDQVRKVAARFRPVEMPTPQEARLAMARHTRAALKGKSGRGGLPDYVVRAMYAEYEKGKSLAEVAAIFGGTRQSVYDVFQVRRLRLRPRHERLLPKIPYGGRDYTMHKGYYRATAGDRKPLHHQIWEDTNGPIPDGWSVTFRDTNRRNFALGNLLGAPIAEVTQYHNARHRRARQEIT